MLLKNQTLSSTTYRPVHMLVRHGKKTWWVFPSTTFHISKLCTHLCRPFPDPLDLCILVDLKYEEDPDDFHYYLDRVNEAIADGIFIDRDIWVMGFHPDDDVDEEAFDQNFEVTNDTLYAMTFIQRLSKLEESANTLRQKGYYDFYKDHPDAKDIWDTRRKFYRRLKNGNERKK